MLKILIMGNDKRSVKVAEILEKTLQNATTMLLQTENQLFKKTDVYLLPIPFSIDGNHINNSSVSIGTEEFFKNIPDNALVISAGYNREGVINMNSRDDFAYKNAVPTAEGAISLAITATESTLSDSHILITGFGRVSKLLAHRLFPFSKHITIAVRKNGDLAHIESLGLKALPIDKLAENLGQFDIIFNTVPSPIFNSKTLSAAKEGSVFIELASGQAGFDVPIIKSLPLIYINAPSLPSKTAPATSGKIMAETVINILKENYG